ncbi:MAG: molybdopterin-dependent oxidoreductase [Chloroflexi bacterium]|nr:molybdopterin-dependent oxidoreductase [Chloroflexota bacterium]
MVRLSRRAFLQIAATSTAALAAACQGAQAAPSATAPARSGSGPTPKPATTDPLRHNPNSAPTEIVVTPTKNLYVQSYDAFPSVDAATYNLTIDGLVENPKSLTLDQIKALPTAEEMLTLECIGNPVGGPLIGNVVWKGFYLEELLKAVKIKPEAIRAKFTAADGYQTSVELKWITQPGVLMAYEINGEPLPVAHGFPLRIRMPGLYGQKQPKWIQRIEFIDEVFTGYWESQGWSDVAAVKTNSKFNQPKNLAKLEAGRVPLFGVAYAGTREITKIEVKIDDGEWQAAELMHGPSAKVWTQWSFDWNAGPGKHSLLVRATDADGNTQTEVASSLFDSAYPDGTNKMHKIVAQIA